MIQIRGRYNREAPPQEKKIVQRWWRDVVERRAGQGRDDQPALR